MKRFAATMLLASLVPMLIISGCTGQKAPEKEIVKVGFSVSLSGVYAAAAESQLNPYLLWEKQVNEQGGLYLPDLDKRVPVELVYYDDKSSSEDVIRIYERLITVDKVDVLFSPWGSTLHMAMVPTMENYKRPLIGTTAGGDLRRRELEGDYFFWTWPLQDLVAPDVVDLMDTNKNALKKVALIYVNDIYPLGFAEQIRPLLIERGYEIVLDKDYPIGVGDMSEVLLQIKSLNPDALVAGSYPGDTILLTKQLQEVGLNVQFLYFAIGPGIIGFEDIFSPEAIDGLTMEGPWHPDSGGPGSEEFFNGFVDMFGTRPDMVDSPFAWLGCQIQQQAIERVGLDPEKVRDEIATGTFQTIFGTFSFDGQENLNYSGILQWQNGQIEMVWPSTRASADLLFPKPDWP
ncbi:amino acid ABC transporter substrate-binding protein [Chloroflexota bacterium]